ncbi:MAG: NAD(P)/FAD-dependent oxidoreductase [Bdellovibrionota bacterium]
MNDETSFDWISIGGGAAGYFGTLEYVGRMHEKGKSCKALILEAATRPLTKVLISGGGRCNVTNACHIPRELIAFYPRGSKELLSVFSKFGPLQTQLWFESKGVHLKTESDGRVFPISDSSQTIVDLFESLRKDRGIELRTKSQVTKIERNQHRWNVTLSTGETFQSTHLLAASGSSQQIWTALQTLGHTLVDPVPSLFSFNSRDVRLKDLAGISFSNLKISGNLGGKKVHTRGDLLITHWGLSGPAILCFSSWFARELCQTNYTTTIQIDFAPDVTMPSCKDLIAAHQEKHEKKQLKNSKLPFFPQRYWLRILDYLQCDPNSTWVHIGKAKKEALLQQVKNASFSIHGKTTNKEEFVTSGGILRKEIDFRTMESKLHPRLYFAGEVMDIDALTGGFNFQNAWSTSYLAAVAASEMDSI